MTRFDGPKMCPRTCSVCYPDHHWMEHVIDLDAMDEGDEELARVLWDHGIECVWVCKHCEAWLEYEPDEDDPQELWERLHESGNTVGRENATT